MQGVRLNLTAERRLPFDDTGIDIVRLSSRQERLPIDENFGLGVSPQNYKLIHLDEENTIKYPSKTGERK